MRRITCFTLFLLQTVRPLAKTAKFWRCANSAPRRPTEPLPASHHNTSVESKNIFFWILYWSHTKPSGSFPLQETMKPWASAPHADNLCKIWTRSEPISPRYEKNVFPIVFLKGKELKHENSMRPLTLSEAGVFLEALIWENSILWWFFTAYKAI